MSENGQSLPSISIGWDAERQVVTMSFDTEEFKSWDFVAAVLGIAKEQALHQGKMAKLGAMQMQQQQVAQEERLKRKLKL